MEGQPPPAVQHDVVVHGEGDGVLPRQPQLPLRAYGGHPGIGRHRADQVGPLPLQPQDDGLDAAVAVPGGAERAGQLAADAGGAGQQSLPEQVGRERGRGAHGTDGV